jgi:hypothetical protein
MGILSAISSLPSCFAAAAEIAHAAAIANDHAAPGGGQGDPTTPKSPAGKSPSGKVSGKDLSAEEQEPAWTWAAFRAKAVDRVMEESEEMGRWFLENLSLLTKLLVFGGLNAGVVSSKGSSSRWRDRG